MSDLAKLAETIDEAARTAQAVPQLTPLKPDYAR